jgi:Flp pilus assembly protein CpaB
MQGPPRTPGASSTRTAAPGDGAIASTVNLSTRGFAARIGRRPTLPTSRAVVGGLLVAVAMVAVFVLASGAAEGPRGRAVVTRRALPLGHRIDIGDVRVEAIDLSDPLAARTFTSADVLIGAVTVAPLGADELIARSAVVDRGGSDPGSHDFSFPIDRERAVNGHLRPGEAVDVLATYGTGETAHTQVVASGVRLLDIEDAGKSTIGSTGKVVVTLSLTSNDDVLATAHASEVAAITLVRSDPVDAKSGS